VSAQHIGGVSRLLFNWAGTSGNALRFHLMFTTELIKFAYMGAMSGPMAGVFVVFHPDGLQAIQVARSTSSSGEDAVAAAINSAAEERYGSIMNSDWNSVLFLLRE